MFTTFIEIKKVGLIFKDFNCVLTMEYTIEMMRTIRWTAEIGKKIKANYPEVADMFRNKKSLSEIAEDLNLSSEYHAKQDIVLRSVRLALKGYPGGFGIRPYRGLLDHVEYKSLASEHQSDRGYDSPVGQGLCYEELSSAGKKGGRTSKRLKLGIFALTIEERVKIGEKAYAAGLGKLTKKDLSRFGRRSCIATGKIHWTRPMLKMAVRLYESGDSWNEVAEAIDQKYCNGQGKITRASANCAVRKYLKSN